MEEVVFVLLLFALVWGWPVLGLVVGAAVGRSRGTKGALTGAAVGLVLGGACSAACYFWVVPEINRAAGMM